MPGEKGATHLCEDSNARIMVSRPRGCGRFNRVPNRMTPFLRKLLGQNWLLLVTTLALAIFGVVAIYSATSTRADAYAADFWRKQANWVAVGVFAFMLTSLVHYRWIRWGALPMYLAGIVFLILTKFIGTKVYGARS